MLGVIHRGWIEESRWGPYIDDFNFVLVVACVEINGLIGRLLCLWG